MPGIAFGLIVVLLFFATAIKILREWERGVILRLGTFHAVRGPGITFVIPLLERMYRINTRVVTIVKRAMEEPMRQIALNAGAKGATIVQRCKAESNGIGYDAVTATFVDLIDAGIVDPTKVTRSALQNAASVAGLLLTTEVLIAELPENAHHININGHIGEMDF